MLSRTLTNEFVHSIYQEYILLIVQCSMTNATHQSMVIVVYVNLHFCSMIALKCVCVCVSVTDYCES